VFTHRADPKFWEAVLALSWLSKVDGCWVVLYYAGYPLFRDLKVALYVGGRCHIDYNLSRTLQHPEARQCRAVAYIVAAMPQGREAVTLIHDPEQTGPLEKRSDSYWP
jgi:hypothetical protein